VFVAACGDEALAAEYRAAYYASNDDPRIAAWAAQHAPVWDTVIDQIEALHPAFASLLDVGAGSGGFLQRVRARRPAVALAAVETAEPARRALERALPNVVFAADRAEALGAADARFDVVTLLQTLEHLHDPLAACRGAHDCLRDGGLLFATVPNRRSFAVWRRGRAADCYANGTHLQFFAWRGLRALLRAAGFRRVRRLASFGGGQYHALLPRALQYALRVAGWSTELRAVAWR
jgi:SAM-dependent methyltransferase